MIIKIAQDCEAEEEKGFCAHSIGLVKKRNLFDFYEISVVCNSRK